MSQCNAYKSRKEGGRLGSKVSFCSHLGGNLPTAVYKRSIKHKVQWVSFKTAERFASLKSNIFSHSWFYSPLSPTLRFIGEELHSALLLSPSLG